MGWGQSGRWQQAGLRANILSAMEIMRPMRADETRVLIVEDEPRVRQLLVREAEAAGFHAMGVWSGEEALRQHAESPFDIVILDYHLPMMDGLQTLQRLRQHTPELQAIVLTA